VERNNYQGCKGEINPFAIEEFDFEKKRYLAEEKYDGIWIDVNFDSKGEVTLISRNLKEKNNTQLESLRKHIRDSIPLVNSNLVGELAFGSQKGTEYATKYGHHKIDFYDIVKLGGKDLTQNNILERKKELHNAISHSDEEWIKETPYVLVTDPKQVREMYDKIVKYGGEGVIVKDIKDEDYRFGGKSPRWYKIKKHVTMDYVIMGYTKTKSVSFAAKGWIGGIVGGLFVNGSLSEKVTVGSMDFSWREAFSTNGDSYIGKVMEVGGFEIFKSGSIRHPYFLKMRDKFAKDCVWKV
jgi:ATP-dependent DNA ligase